jgi:hypothetical protein
MQPAESRSNTSQLRRKGKESGGELKRKTRERNELSVQELLSAKISQTRVKIRPIAAADFDSRANPHLAPK